MTVRAYMRMLLREYSRQYKQSTPQHWPHVPMRRHARERHQCVVFRAPTGAIFIGVDRGGQGRLNPPREALPQRKLLQSRWNFDQAIRKRAKRVELRLKL